MESPFHLFATFANRRDFLSHYMMHAPFGGLFIDVAREFFPDDSPIAPAWDPQTWIGRIAEVRLEIAHPPLSIGFRGIVVSAETPLARSSSIRVGVEFFRYEANKNAFLLEQMNSPPSVPHTFADLRHAQRIPAHLRVEFHCSARAEPHRALAREGSRITVISRTQDLSTTGCAFHTTRFLRPGSRMKVTLYPSLDLASAVDPHLLTLQTTIRWSDPQNFQHRQMGLQFDFTDSATLAQRPIVQGIVGRLRANLEKHYVWQNLST